ncbi:hypothetical protein [Halorubrum ezzemoulense]|uniref:hypothetical protein n=1 Tax=Halorubrum ezzemoulense TaxID=337243 RepID=UPI00114030CA|nr:hypothetical protein [Halorubrum ezzemoulense]
MNEIAKQNGRSYRKLTDTGQVTVPSEHRDEEAGYTIERKDDGRLILTPQDEIIVSSDFRKISEKGQVTIHAEYRGEEDGYVVEQTEDGRIILTPAYRTETIETAAAHE